MAENIVRILPLGPLRLARVQVIGTGPEMEAHGKLKAWAEPLGLLADQSTFRFFGGNEPPPQPGKVEYGYESMMTIAQDIEPSGEITLVEFPERKCAVVRASLHTITKMWHFLYDWVEKSDEYSITGHGLEELLNPLETDEQKFIFDLWLPVG
jgi:hypothetical protein